MPVNRPGVRLASLPKSQTNQQTRRPPAGGLGEEEVSRQMRWEGVGGPMSRYRPTPPANAPTTHHQPPRNNTHTHARKRTTPSSSLPSGQLHVSPSLPLTRFTLLPPPICMPRGATPDLHCSPLPEVASADQCLSSVCTPVARGCQTVPPGCLTSKVGTPYHPGGFLVPTTVDDPSAEANSKRTCVPCARARVCVCIRICASSVCKPHPNAGCRFGPAPGRQGAAAAGVRWSFGLAWDMSARKDGKKGPRFSCPNRAGKALASPRPPWS
ncbi:hypothetical protein K456DRAFT_1385977 [Colletotrichum gloeosporioides 23]|nr:hypothetical protein K456DRAFT_1385977 [Colletotrichum gloeosporioides 23]